MIKAKRPVIAFCHDFDKTLTPDDMQEQGFTQTVQLEENDKIKDFWKESNNRVTENDMDQILVYMLTMKDRAGNKVPFKGIALADYGPKVKLFEGVKTWFDRINAYE